MRIKTKLGAIIVASALFASALPASANAESLLPVSTCSDGEVASPIISAVDVPGGTRYVFDVNGEYVDSSVPNLDFEPTEATASQLAEFGYPEKPVDTAEVAVWKADVLRLKLNFIPSFCQSVDQSFDSGQVTSGNWAGYIANDPSSTAYTGIKAKLVQPLVSATACLGAEVSHWVGLGGSNSTQGLIQAGTRYKSTGYSAWIEWLTSTNVNLPITLGQVSVNPGDDIRISITRSLVAADNGKTVFAIDNMTNGSHQTATKNIPSIYYFGGTAEVVDERPALYNPSTGTTTLLPLANYGQALWSLIYVLKLNGTYAELATQNESRITMVSSGTTLDQPDLMSSSSSFTDRFTRCL
jgi:hypothetical protein